MIENPTSSNWRQFDYTFVLFTNKSGLGITELNPGPVFPIVDFLFGQMGQTLGKNKQPSSSPSAVFCFFAKECDGVTLHLKKRMDQLEMKLREHTDDSLHSFEARVSQDLQVAEVA